MKRFTALIASLLYASGVFASSIIYEPCVSSLQTFCSIQNLYETSTGTGSLDPKYAVLPFPQITGTTVNNDCAKFSNGKLADSGAPCGATSTPVGAVIDHSTIGATVTLDFSAGNYHKFTQTSAVDETITFVDPTTPRMVYVQITAPASGTVPAVTWPNSFGFFPPPTYPVAYTGGNSTLAMFWNGTVYVYQMTLTDFGNSVTTPFFAGSVYWGSVNGPAANPTGFSEFAINTYETPDLVYAVSSTNAGVINDDAWQINRITPTATTWGMSIGDYGFNLSTSFNNNVIVNGNTFNPYLQEVGLQQFKQAGFGLFNYANGTGNAAARGGASLTLGRSNGTINTVSFVGVPTWTALASGDIIAPISFQGSDGTATTFVEGARIQSAATAAWSNTSHPADIEFYTTPAASTTPVKVLTIGSDGTLSGSAAGSGAPYQISYQPGFITTLVNTKSVYAKVSKASTVDNMIASAQSLTTCTTNPTITMYECGTSTTCAAPTTIASVQITATGTATPATVSSPAIAAGDYIAFAISGGACASLDIAATAQVHTN
jgi:hypothetical protein